MMADGLSLLDKPRLIATIREFAWWVRDVRYSRIEHAATHKATVVKAIYLAHALTLRGLTSFAQLQPYDVELLVEECRYGTDAVLRASERIKSHIDACAAGVGFPRRGHPGIAEYKNQTGYPTGLVDRRALIEACRLPLGSLKIVRVSALISRAAIENGFRVPRPAEKLSDLPPQVNVTAQELQRWLDPLEQLYEMRRRLHDEGVDTIGFRPFPTGAARVAAVKGVGTERTPIPPFILAMHLLEQSAMWLFNPAKAVTKSSPLSEVRLLATACWIIIATFSARRDSEVDDLDCDCLAGDEESGWWLHVYIEKTLKRKDWIPIPFLVAHAVRTLVAISQPARESNGSVKSLIRN